MKNKLLLLLISVGIFSSCDKFLDEIPDNRVQITKGEQVGLLLAGAYPSNTPLSFWEMSSDNIGQCLSSDPRTASLYADAIFNWQDIPQDGNDAPERFWGNSWKCISASVYAMDALKELKNISEKEKKGFMAEAHLIRAYNELNITQTFCQAYDPKYAEQDLGMPYMDKPVTNVHIVYPRKTLAETYALIAQDIEAGVNNIDNELYSKEKYRFNKNAANALATRFYLYYQKWDKVIEHANNILKDEPESFLSPWKAIAQLPNDNQTRGNQFVSVAEKSNLMLIDAYSSCYRWWGYWFIWGKYTHNDFIAIKQCEMAQHPWGGVRSWNDFICRPITLIPIAGGKMFYTKGAENFEETNPVERTGLAHITYRAFSGDEVLLSRAEAYIHKGEYQKAIDDMNIYLRSFYTNPTPLTEERIIEWFNKTKYNSAENLSPKFKLSPAFEIKDEKQEAMLQTVLNCRRIATLQEGLRWEDIKRYGIETQRYSIAENFKSCTPLDNILKPRDLRMALQLPQSVIDAGMKENPRVKTN